MTKMIRFLMALAVVMSLAGAVSFAQSGGEAIYKAKCAGCHGATGTPSAGMAKMGVKPASDPSIQSLTVAQMIASIKASPKMKSVASLPDPQLKEAVIYYKGLK
jgi:mono/diheme cytochrome c family protein